MKSKTEWWAIVIALAALVGCGGESFIGGGEDAGGTGGTGGTSGSSGTSGSTGASPGSAGSGGSSGSSPGGMLPISSAACDFSVALATCAASGCHKPTSAIAVSAGLSLVPNSGFVSRVKDVPATHGDIYCGSLPCPTIPAECPTDALLVDSADWEASWIYRKITDPMGCGEQMPPAGTLVDPAQRACIVLLVKTIAELP